ncbi:MAG: GDSL-type esterase/lipase family protein, partial [Myxococcota bacterium]|nr:GDSL-type esterase/lipase family protein [Myxococcota bacterium]
VFSASGPGKHTFEVRASGGGNVHTYGVTLETAGPGIVYDAVQMVGTRSSRLLNFNSEHIKAQVEHRSPDLQVFMYGGNEVGDSGSLDTYAEKYTAAIRRMRAGRPEASCLVMTPVAHGEKYRGRIRTNRRMLEMVPIQRSIAASVGCAFYNTFEAMGGDGASGRWYKSGLMSGDFAHMTSKGNKVLGVMFYQALLKDFAHWLSDHPDA